MIGNRFIGAAVLLLSAISLKADITVTSTDCALHADKRGNVAILDKKGSNLISLNGIDLSWAPPRTDGGTATQIDEHTIRVEYRVKNDKTGKLKFSGLFSCRGNQVEARYTIASPGVKVRTKGAMYQRKLKSVSRASRLLKRGEWVRHAKGGVPYEVSDVLLRRHEGKQVALFEVIAGNSNWQNNSAQHITFRKTDKDHYQAANTFLLLPKSTPDEVAAAIYKQRPASVAIVSEQPFNLWKSGENPKLKVIIANTSGNELDRVDYRFFVRNYDGKLIQETSDTLQLAAGELKTVPVEIVPESENELYIVEASVTTNGREAFTRSMLAVMPDHEFQHKETSIFGLAAHFDIPSEQDVDRLLKRMGVRWLRRGNSKQTTPHIGAVANWHSNVKPMQWAASPEKRRSHLESELKKCDQRQNPYWEFGNEWNMSALNTGKYADTYVKNWLKPLAKLKLEGNYKVKLLSMGIAGGDTAFLRAIHKQGGWDLLDGVAIHPGRGNFTADYDNPKIAWTYLGSVRKVKKVVAELGQKPLWITEAYACTAPNGWWYDSYRRAAENIILTYALGMAEGVQCVMFYQLQDSVWYNKGGVNPKDNEYFYGLLHRDGTVKPSLLAYRAIAEALDGAKFVRHLSFNNSTTKGLLFARPEGQMAILWNRKDGYLQSRKRPDFASPEPWVDHWKSFTESEIPANGDTIRVVDSIGRKRTLGTRLGKASITLSGAPVMVYGTAY
jgi:hypothetical protein